MANDVSPGQSSRNGFYLICGLAGLNQIVAEIINRRDAWLSAPQFVMRPA